MNKPTKKGFLVGQNTADKNWEISVCNKSCDEWEAFLPDVNEIRDIVQEITLKHFAPATFRFKEHLANVIAKRIGK